MMIPKITKRRFRCGVLDRRNLRTTRGFSLVELLVTVGIVSILAAIAIPSITASREISRSLLCTQRLSSVMAAVLQYEQYKRKLPGWVESFGFYEAKSRRLQPGKVIHDQDHVKVGTWAIQLLPYLDHQTAYEIWTEVRYPIYGGREEGVGLSDNPYAGYGYKPEAVPNVEYLQCPSDPTDKGSFGRNSYVSNNGFCYFNERGRLVEPHGKQFYDTIQAFENAQRVANGAFVCKAACSPVEIRRRGPRSFPGGPEIRLRQIQDSLSKTVLFSENLQALPWHRAGLAMHQKGKNSFFPGIVTYEGNAIGFARYTTGMVFFYEDDDLQVQERTKCEPIAPVHLINGGLPGKDKFQLQMPTKVSSANVALAANLARPSSAHDGGVHMGFADGAVRFVSETIDYRVYQTYMTLDGKKSDMPWRRDVMNLKSPEEGE